MNFIVREPRALNRALELDCFLGKGHDEQTRSKLMNRFKLNRREERKGTGKNEIAEVGYLCTKGEDIRGPHEERTRASSSRKCAFISRGPSFPWMVVGVLLSALVCLLNFSWRIECGSGRKN